MTILVTGAAGPAGSSLLGQLVARGHEVVACDAAPSAGQLPVPLAADEGFARALAALIGKTAVSLVVPTVSEELPILASIASGFGLDRWFADARILIGELPAVAIADDKLATARVLAHAGVPVPETWAPEEWKTGRRTGRWVLKPRVSRGGRGVRVLSTAELRGLIEAGAVPAGQLIQSFAPGAEYAPVLFRSSTAMTVDVLEKTGLRSGLHGNATGVRLVEDEAVADVAAGAMEALGLFGPADIDVRRDATGRPVVLEVNARFGANSAAAPSALDLALHTLQVRP